MEESISLNIVYLPDGKTSQKAIELSEKITSKLPSEFTLENDRIPHITIYHVSLPAKNLRELKKVIGQIASKTKPFTIAVDRFFANGGLPGFLWWKCVNSKNLEKLIREIIERVNPLREGLIQEGLKNYQGSKDKKKEIETYGTLLNAPHITITRLKNPNDSKKALEVLGKREKSTFQVKSIALGSLGDHGTVTEIIEEFLLPF